MKNSETKPALNQENYFETLQTEAHYSSSRNFAKVEIYSYTKLGCTIASILNVCRQSLENPNNFIDSIDYCNLLELATDLIPHPELELLDNIHQQSKTQENENN